MNRRRRVTVVGAAVALCWAGLASASPFTLQVADFTPGQTLPQAQAYGSCGGQDISPTLHWSGAPEGTRSFAVTVFDSDARGGRGWWHWLAWNISPERTGLARDAGWRNASGMAQGRNDFGHRRYDGPCPPPGPAHHYVFTVYALDTAHLQPRGDTPAAIGRAIKAHALARVRQRFRYQRP